MANVRASFSLHALNYLRKLPPPTTISCVFAIFLDQETYSWSVIQKWIESETLHGIWGVEETQSTTSTTPTPPPGPGGIDWMIIIIIGGEGVGIGVTITIIIFSRKGTTGEPSTDKYNW